MNDPSVFVQTPALKAAADHSNPHCFFVGRRGTGKTATTKYLVENAPNVILIRPEIFSPSSLALPIDDFTDANQKPFRSLLSAFKRSVVDEVLFDIFNGKSAASQTPDVVRVERDLCGDYDFDLRVLHFISTLTKGLSLADEIVWLKEMKATKPLTKTLSETRLPRPYTIILDAIDDFWDGSQQAVLYLTALMHAALEINSQIEQVRVVIFLRENIFERVRKFDSEFSRLETCVVGLDWTEDQLVEMIERRINAPLTAKIALGGDTWDAFFEHGAQARSLVLDFCQHRPRDVLTYCSLALDNAQGHKHSLVMIDDLQSARRRFSDSRLKDLSDEYQENYPQIAVILESFYGLGQRFTATGLEDFLNRLLDDHLVVSACKEWIYEYSAVEPFVRLMYDIGFFGLIDINRKQKTGVPVFRSLGPRDTTPPAIDERTEMLIHPSYHDALELQDVLVGSLSEGQNLRRSGMIVELPGALKLDEYRELLEVLLHRLKTLPNGKPGAVEFEDLVGDVIRTCFFRPLSNLEAQSRDVGGAIRRDWIASNRAQFGFWEMIRQRYDATQVIFECKNYANLEAGDFHQASYYQGTVAGRFLIIVFRGEIKRHYFEHMRRIVSSNGMVLLLNDRDLAVFMRQARKGVVKDDHIQERYDQIVRSLS